LTSFHGDKGMVSKRVIRVVALALLLPTSLLRSQTTETYIDQAYRHSAAVLERSDDPCPDDSDVPREVCMAKELSLVGQHLDALVDDLRAMFAIKQASRQVGEQSELEILNKADAAWRLYRAQVCKLSFGYFKGGQESIAVLDSGICELRLDRAYVLQLNPLITPHRITK
jgi:uncharacterized protein YecT (DUF1311 family)